ncbi:MAG: hypothetical protein U0166_12090 [Acidobacteriota bacterium]
MPGPRPLRSSYLVKKAAFAACHEWSFLERLDVLARAAPGAVFLVNSPIPAARVWDHLPWEAQEAIVAEGPPPSSSSTPTGSPGKRVSAGASTP